MKIPRNAIVNNDQVFAELQTERWPLPLNFQFGVAMELMDNEMHRMTVASDALHPSDNTEAVNPVHNQDLVRFHNP